MKRVGYRAEFAAAVEASASYMPPIMGAGHLYENVYCERGQMENLIKLHKA